MEADVVYNRAPIVEAVLDIRVDLPSDFPKTKLRKCNRDVEAEYPIVEELQLVRGEVEFGETLRTTASTKFSGYRFVAGDKRQAFRADLEGFSFHKLAPYDKWETFVGEAKRLWEVYRSTTHPKGYKRLGLRYINRFDFPIPSIKMEDYFRTYPEVSRDLPQEMRRFFSRVELPLAEIDAVAAIAQTTGRPQEPAHTSILLDIDLFKVDGLPSGQEIWPVFATLRRWKNKVFEACITHQAREGIR